MESKKKKKKLSIFHYVKFDNLYKEIEGYGYRYDMKSYLKSYIIALVSVLGVGIAFCLHPAAIAFLAVVMFLSVPKIILNQFRFVYEQDRFEDSTSYMESLIYSFRKNGKILESLKDIRELSNERIRNYIDKAVESINQANDIDMYENALAVIEEEYGSPRMKSLHNFLIKAESIGGNYNRSFNILIKDLKEWNKNTYLMLHNHKLAKAISSVSWSKFFEMLAYKAVWYGADIIKVPTNYPSSQTCHCCGYKNPLVKNLAIRCWECPECRTVHDRDQNASINILKKGLLMQSV